MIKRALSSELFPCAFVFAWTAIVTLCDHTFFRGTHYMLGGAVAGVAVSYVVRVLSARSLESVLVSEVDAWEGLAVPTDVFVLVSGVVISVAVGAGLHRLAERLRARVSSKVEARS